MNSAERARESARYESALLEGTYNNPMNQPGMNIGAEYARRYANQKRAEEEARQQALHEQQLERQRRQQEEASYQRYLEQIAQENQARLQRQALQRAREAAGRGRQNLSSYYLVAAGLRQVADGELGSSATAVLAACAYHLNDLQMPDRPLKEVLGGSSTLRVREAVVRLADECLRRGEMLPALLLADPALRSDEYVKLLSFQGTQPGYRDDQLHLVFYTGWWWPEEDDMNLAERQGILGADWRAEYARMKPLAEGWGQRGGRDQFTCVSRILRSSRILPWMGGKRRIGFYTPYELQQLRSLNPSLGFFVTGLMEERYRLNEAQASPYSDLLFEKAAQMAGPGFIQDFAALRRSKLRAGDAEALAAWRSYRLRGANSAELASLRDDPLFRVAARLALDQDLSGVDPDYGALGDEAQQLRFRRLQVHGLLWDLTLKGNRRAFVVQYLAAAQDPEARIPTLHSYLNAFRWLLGWDQEPEHLRDLALTASSQLEVTPISIPGRFYGGSKGLEAMEVSVAPDPKRPGELIQLYSNSNYGFFPEGLHVPLAGALRPAVLLHRGVGAERLPDVLEAQKGHLKFGFSGQLALAQLAAWGHRCENQELLRESMENLTRIRSSGTEHEDLVRNVSLAGLEVCATQALEGAFLPGSPAPDLRGLNGDRELQFGRALWDSMLLCWARLETPAGYPSLDQLPGGFLSPLLRRAAAAHGLSLQGSNGGRGTLLVNGNLFNLEQLHHWLLEAARKGCLRSRTVLASRRLAADPIATRLLPNSGEAEAWLLEAARAGIPGALAPLLASKHPPSALELAPLRALAARQGDAGAAFECLKLTPLKGNPGTAALLERLEWLASAAQDQRTASMKQLAAELTPLVTLLEAEPLCLLETTLARTAGERAGEALARFVVLADLNRAADRAPSEYYPNYTVENDTLLILAMRLLALLPDGPGVTAARSALAQSHFLRRLRWPKADTQLIILKETQGVQLLQLRSIDVMKWAEHYEAWVRFEIAARAFENLPGAPWSLPTWDDNTFASLASAQAQGLYGRGLNSEDRLVLLRQLLPFAAARLDLLQEQRREELFKALAKLAETSQANPQLARHPDWQPLITSLRNRAPGDPQCAPLADELEARLGDEATTLRVIKTWIQSGRDSRALYWLHKETSLAGCLELLSLAESLPLSRPGEAAWLDKLGSHCRFYHENWGATPQQLAAVAERLQELALSRCTGPRLAPEQLQVGLNLLLAAKALEGKRLAFSRWLALNPVDRIPKPSENETLRVLFFEARDEALKQKDLPALQMLATLSPELVSDEIDEVQGWPKRKAAEEAKARTDGLLDRGFALLEGKQHRVLGARLIGHAMRQGATMHPLGHLSAAKALGSTEDGKPGLAATPVLRRLQLAFLTEAITSPHSGEEIDQALLELEPVCRTLWETRAQWSRHNELGLFWLVRSYGFSSVKHPWAVQAWKELCTAPSPAFRMVMASSGLTEPEMPPLPTEEEQNSAAFVEASLHLLEAFANEDDPLPELQALDAG